MNSREAIETLRRKRGPEQVGFGNIADHLTDFAERNPEHDAVVADLAQFLAVVEDVPHDHDADPRRGLGDR